MPNSNLLNFNEALEYLRAKGHPLSPWGMRKEVKNFPERFGAMRRNPLASRGRGGRFFFPVEALDKYKSLQETYIRK